MITFGEGSLLANRDRISRRARRRVDRTAETVVLSDLYVRD